jgi:hypothetical protein
MTATGDLSGGAADLATPPTDAVGTGQEGASRPVLLPGDFRTVVTAGSAAAAELRHGFTLESLTRLAHFAARRGHYDRGIPLPERFEAAWSAMAESLYAAEEEPSIEDLLQAGWLAIRHYAERDRQFRGRAHDGPAGPGRNFERYWHAVSAPVDSPEDRLIDRIALDQIWPRLTPASREALTALAACEDYRRAAESLGLGYRTFVCRISEARRQFLRLWHDGEKPSRLWVRDRREGPGTDMHTVTYFLRSRRLRKAALEARGVPEDR